MSPSLASRMPHVREQSASCPVVLLYYSQGMSKLRTVRVDNQEFGTCTQEEQTYIVGHQLLAHHDEAAGVLHLVHVHTGSRRRNVESHGHKSMQAVHSWLYER